MPTRVLAAAPDPQDRPVPTVERGYQVDGVDAAWWSPPIDDEETPELAWPLSIKVYDRMRRQDAQVKSVLSAVSLPILRTEWRVDGAGCRPEVTQLVADDLGLPIVGRETAPLPRTRDRFSWPEHIRLALTCLPFGHSFFEQTYRLDEKLLIDGVPAARIRKLGWRPPRTISQLDVARDGGLVRIHQSAILAAGKADTATIPTSQLVVYVNDREGGNWLGQSLLRPAYKFWLLKDRALRTGSITLDRNGVGVPVYTAPPVPEGIKNPADRIALQREDMRIGQELTTAFRGGENAGASLPHGAELELKGVEGSLPDAEKDIRYFDEQIARSALGHFLNLGTQTGSWALGSTFADFFTLSLQTVAKQIAETATKHIVEDLVDLNWGPEEPAPRITFDEIGSQQQLTDQGLKMLVDAGIITLDEPLERYVRMRRGLPAHDPGTARAHRPVVAGQQPSQDPPAKEAQ